ncbi:MAG: histidine--tRNA ligase [Deltaproteobacteria bacterium]|nr:histidine--tRNA ligase [Deltaproteobacteria bacterium]
MGKPVYQKVRGMHDILPDASHRWEAVEAAYREVVGLYNYREIRNPLLEDTGLFQRSIGDDTDIVGKEMYSFTDAGGDELTLRPEGTAGVVRAYVEHSIAAVEAVTKCYYIGPMFRRERPQKGRYRQFHQAGAEIFGAPPPVVDAEQVVMLAEFLDRIGLGGAVVLFNHLGSGETRRRYRQLLSEHYGARRSELCTDCVRRLETNPLRLLDCKVESCAKMKGDAPKMREILDGADLSLLERFRSLLHAAGVEAREDDRLVRGLDYYTGIVYEVEVEAERGSVVVAGGGRYDDLVAGLGGSETPAAGFAIGLERVLDCLPESPPASVDLFVLVPSPEAEATAASLLLEARRAGLRADLDPRAGSMKAQMKRANKLGSAYVLILGQKELEAGTVAVKDMREGGQVDVDVAAAVKHVLERLGR